MGETTAIGWCDHTLNPILGCQRVSPGCVNCYAETMTPVRVLRSRGEETWGPSGTRHETKRWEADARKWNYAAQLACQRRRVFCASASDVFEDRPEWLAVRARLAALTVACPWLDFLFVTKRIELAQRLWSAACPFSRVGGEDTWFATMPEHYCVCGEHAGAKGWARNIWIGTTVEDQQRAEERIPHLLRIPAAVRFLSVEPQLEPIDLTYLVMRKSRSCEDHYSALECDVDAEDDGDWQGRTVDWVIQGGESGSKARPFRIDWARHLRDQCENAGTAYFLKQLGAHVIWNGCAAPDEQWPPGTAMRDNTIVTDGRAPGWRIELRDSTHGANESEWPPDLRGKRAMPRPPAPEVLAEAPPTETPPEGPPS